MVEKKYEDFGSLKDFCKNYGNCRIYTGNLNDPNITITIKSDQEIEFKIVCSIALSEIIRNGEGLPSNIYDYHVLRITESDEQIYIRISQSISVEGDSSLSLTENMEIAKDIPGNVTISFKASDLKAEPLKPKSFDDLFEK